MKEREYAGEKEGTPTRDRGDAGCLWVGEEIKESGRENRERERERERERMDEIEERTMKKRKNMA